MKILMLLAASHWPLPAAVPRDDRTSESTPFSYDASAPLHYVDRGVVNHGYPIAVHDVSFTSSGQRVDAMLAVPPGKGPFPGVVYLHGTGGDHTELLVPATWMAARGVVALTITMPELAATTGTASQKLVAQRKAAVAAVVAARRAVDCSSRYRGSTTTGSRSSGGARVRGSAPSSPASING